MFEKLIADILQRVLGTYIEDVDPKKMNLSLSSGKVKLENVKLKPSILESFQLPFTIVYGQIGLIDITIPIWNLLNASLQIEVKDVFALVVPKGVNQWSEEEVQDMFRQKIQAKLDQFELLQENIELMTKKDSTSINKIVNKLIQNAQVSIKNVFIRYEDELTAQTEGEGKFIIGIKLKNFQYKTTNQEWQQQINSNSSNLINKILLVQGLTLFVDYRDKYNQKLQNKSDDKLLNMQRLGYDQDGKILREIMDQEFHSDVNQQNKHDVLLDNLQLECRIQMASNSFEYKLPKFSINILLRQDSQNQQESINLVIKSAQIIRILKLLQFINFFNEFSQKSLLAYQNSKVTEKSANKYIATYVKWKVTQNNVKQQKNREKRLKALQKKELHYTYEKLQILRKYALKLLDQEQQVLEDYKKKQTESKEEKKSDILTELEKKAPNWREIENKKLLEEQKIKKKQEALVEQERVRKEEIQALLIELEEESIIQNDDLKTLDENSVEFCLELKVHQLSFTFSNEYNQSVFKGIIKDIISKGEYGPNFNRYELSIKSFIIEDKWSRASTFPNFLDEQSELKQKMEQENESEDQLLSLKYEWSQNMRAKIFEVNISKVLIVIVNPYLFKEVFRCYNKLSNQFKTQELSIYKYVYQRIIEPYFSGIKSEFRNLTLELKGKIRAPIILIPENVFQCLKPTFVIDLGQISIQTTMLQKMDSTKDYKSISSPDSLYDTYEIKVDNISLQLLSNGLNDGINSFCNYLLSNQNESSLKDVKLIDNYKNHNGGIQIIQDIQVRFNIFKCIEPLHPQFPSLELSVEVDNIQLQAQLVVIEALFKIQNNIKDIWLAKEYKLVQDEKISKQSDVQFFKTNSLSIVIEIRTNNFRNQTENAEKEIGF